MNNGSTAMGGSNTFQRTFTVMVTPVNQPPTLDPIGNLTFVEGTGTATATATLSNTALGTVGAITVTSAGAGYLSAPAVTLVGGGGLGNGFVPATAVANLTNGQITGITDHQSRHGLHLGPDRRDRRPPTIGTVSPDGHHPRAR